MTDLDARDTNSAVVKYLTSLPQDVRWTILRQHFSTLKEYARRTLDAPGALTREEQRDRQFRLSELMIIGHSFGLTNRQIVNHLYQGLLAPGSVCACPACAADGDAQP